MTQLLIEWLDRIVKPNVDCNTDVGGKGSDTRQGLAYQIQMDLDWICDCTYDGVGRDKCVLEAEH